MTSNIYLLFVTIISLWSPSHRFYISLSFSVSELLVCYNYNADLAASGWCHRASFSPDVWTIPGPANISRSFPVCVLLSEEIGSQGLGGLLLILWRYQGFTGTLVISQRGNGKTGQSLPADSHQTNMDKHTHPAILSFTQSTHTKTYTHKHVHKHTKT